MKSGIRQGCPLAPITFALVMDVLLRYIRLKLADEVFCRAFADDVGLVIKDRKKVLPEVARILEEFGEISGMKVNIAKTAGIIVTKEDPGEIREEIVAHTPAWSTLTLGTTAKYLGYFVGPDKAQRQWQEVMEKIIDRSVVWEWSQAGIHFASIIYIQHLPGGDGEL